MVGPTAGATSIVGRDLTSQAGFASLAALFESSAKSSGEHETSFGSLAARTSRDRVWANADIEQRPRATSVTRVRRTSFREYIIKRGRTFSLLVSTFVSCLSEEGTAKRLGQCSGSNMVFQLAM